MLGYVGVATGVGFALGPAAGGLLSAVSLTCTTWVATAGSLFSFFSVMLLLPRTIKLQPSNKPTPSVHHGPGNNGNNGSGGLDDDDSSTEAGPAGGSSKEPYWQRFCKVDRDSAPLILRLRIDLSTG